MSLRDDSVPLRHMRDHCAEGAAVAAAHTRGDLDADRMLALALTRIVEIVGEAASRVSEDTRSAHPEIPWKQVVGTGNRLIHGYDNVDMDILWRIVSEELGPLAKHLDAILGAPLFHE